LKKVDNLLIPPISYYGPHYNAPYTEDNYNNNEAILAWKKMPDSYVILPEIFADRLKNPLVYNIRTKKFGCYYTVSRMWDGTVQGSMGNFLRNSVKKARKAGARECVVNLGNDDLFIDKNVQKLKFAIASDNDRGMDVITLIRNGVYSHYTTLQILSL
jgi:hypothetical protein